MPSLGGLPLKGLGLVNIYLLDDCLSQMPSLGDLNLKGVTPVNVYLLDNPILITLPLPITKENPCGESGQSGHGS